MLFETLQGILLPFLGTVLGAACVFIMRDALPPAVQKSLTGFAVEFHCMASAVKATAAAAWDRPCKMRAKPPRGQEPSIQIRKKTL